MASVEDKIVAMKFDNKQFEPAAKTTMSTLDRLKAALNFGNAGKGLTDLQNTANRFSLAGLANGAQGVSGKFLAMAAVAATAIANIVNRAVDAGIRIAKAFTLDPLKQGFQEYETNLNAVQTILANTQASGANLKDVNATLQELNAYSDKTIYNFSEMARNIGTFTAAGVDLKTASGSIKGIANLAALSGSNSQQASTAMYQLSQAISSGSVSLQDWNSVVNAGMGGTVFQRALAQNAEKMGTLSKGAVELKGKMKNVSIEGKSFRESITAKPGEESWLTSEVLTRTLEQFTGDLSDADLAAQGFSKSQIKAIQEQAKTAQDAATQVKTFTQLVGTLQESAGSGWAQTFQILLGDFEEAKKLWTNVNNVVGGFIGDSAKARNEMLQTWKDLGGRTKALKAIQNIFKALVQVVTPIKEAFRQIFPATTGKELFALTERFLAFTKTLKIGATTAANLKRTFAGFFAIFSIGWSLTKAILNVLGDLFGLVGKSSGSFLEVTGSIGDFLVKLDKTIKKGDVFNKFFKTLANVLKVPIAFLQALGDAIVDFFKNMDGSPLEILGNLMDRFRDRLSSLGGLSGRVAAAWGVLVSIFQRVAQFLQPAIDVIKDAFSGIGEAIGKAFEAGDFSSVFDALNTGLLTGIVLLIRKFLSNGLKIDFGGGFLDSIKGTFGALTDTLTAMQNQVQANTILKIAGAVALLTVSIVALSLIDSAALTKSLAAIGVAFGYMLAAMAILTKISGSAGFVKIPVIAASMVILATAVLILTAAVKNLSDLSWGELAKGLAGTGALLLMIVGVSKGLEKSSGSMLRAGLAMIPLAIGLKILASALSDMGGMSWDEIGRGLATLGGAMAILAVGLSLMSGTLAGSAGLLVAAVAMNVLVPVLERMGQLKWGEFAKAMATLAGSLLILAGGLYLMAGTLPGAAGLLVAAAAFTVLMPVLERMAALSWSEFAKGMAVLAGSLLILAVGLTAMILTLPGSAALTVAAAALAVLTPILLLLGMTPWPVLLQGLGALAAVFLVLGISALVLAPVVPVIIALAAALVVLGAGVILIGGGLLAIATAFSIFAAAGTAGLIVLTGMINLIPLFLAKFAEGIISFATTIADQAGKFTRAFASLLSSLLDAVILVTPKVGQAITVMLQTALNIISANAPRIAAVGIRLMMAFLSAVNRNIPQIVNTCASIIVRAIRAMTARVPQIARVGTDLILKLMTAIGAQQGRLLQKGASMIISFINKLASTIRANQSEMNAAGRNLAGAIISGMVSGIGAGIRSVIGAAQRMAQSALSAAKAALKSNSPSLEFMKLGADSDKGMAIGFTRYSHVVENAASNVSTAALEQVRQTMQGLTEAFSGDVNLNPVIKPILDLTNISQSASQIGSMLDQKAITADISYRQAMGIAQERSLVSDSTSTPETGGDTYIQMEQNIVAPRMPSTVEIYRNTNSLLSLAKEGLSKK